MNVFTATGNLGQDCRVGNAGGTAVCNFSLAVKSGFGDKAQTIWLDCALWGKKAEGRLPEFLVKGTQAAVTGELGTREHEGKTYITLRVSELTLIGGKGDAAPQAQAQEPQQQAQQPQQAQAPAFDYDLDVPF